MDWLQRIAELVASDGAAARVVIVEVSGPTPRAAGADMLVTMSAAAGKIGRGAIEREAIATARGLIAQVEVPGGNPRWPRAVLRFETGPVLGERSGGSVVLLVEAFGSAEIEALSRLRSRLDGEYLVARAVIAGVPTVMPPLEPTTKAGRVAVEDPWREAVTRFRNDPRLTIVHVAPHGEASAVVERFAPRREPFHVYGTGLAARALVRLLADLPFDVTWVDVEPAHFPVAVPERVRAISSADPAMLARATPAGGFHAVMTASHDLDLAVCRALLEADGFAYLGVIGSRLKRQRLLARLKQDGVPEARLAQVVCPIGLGEIKSKQPPVIAVSIAAQALIVLQGAQKAVPPTQQAPLSKPQLSNR